MNTEIWKDILGYEGFYQVSNLGRVRSLDRNIIYSNGRRHFSYGKILNPFLDRGGYRKVNLSKNRKVTKIKVARLVALTFFPNSNKFFEIHHKNHNKIDDCVENLEWISPQKHRLLHSGEKHYNSKLTKKQVINIQKLYLETNLSSSDIALKFNVSQGTILKIVRGGGWKNLKLNKLTKKNNRCGSDHPNARLSVNDVRQIKFLFSTNQFTVKELAHKYKLSTSGIYYIIRGETWKSVN